ncbi:bifunctional hydroxymethylpyrimidine kinase/phosphomethylpyrimidine kinase [Sphingomonas nostoxanthinifaciens]|uniref:bifunctional hydroxymethylpyrimidine kinase/phosphomethylpyrimidine kinase n=1 Tax=Sphingomonas nostoxanthinifaciens TaxID=2872652 RepID=UPI001CC1D2F1|nr:bifunctional hydroxymethylpyrimidine kinase/phosphomethylpyrimidine kinase [Sphingomonas nostoxanthinifaciens]UAK23354.1 bifunctional hydroxymethylpyrimidine kinase/phosphomethylpyrimidine kinase [Sphingomonas nostoxanthinifaciens]
MIPRILAIAGSDSGGGAGIQADIKTITMLGGHAMTAVTALTAQNTLGVDAIMPVPAAMVTAQIDAVVRDIGVDAIKIGMIGSAEIAEAVAGALPDVAIVLDPVMVASSGAMLADGATIAMLERLMVRATLLTPNLPELAALTGRDIDGVGAVEAAAHALADRLGVAVLAKGGHGDGPELVDLLVAPDGVTRWRSERIDTRHSHGTGCTLSSAIATGLGGGMPLVEAIGRARDYVRAALRAAPGLGGGHGPLGHGLGRAHFS